MRFNILRSAHRAAPRKNQRSSIRLLLERLEERLVPTAAADGDILVATLPSQGFTQADQSGFPTGLIGVRQNPPPVAQYQLSTDQVLGAGNFLVFPTYTAEGINVNNQAQLYETDLQYNLGNGSYTSTTLTDATKSWRANQFAGGTVQILDKTTGAVLQQRFVISNTATQLTVDHAWNPTPPSGQRYQVYGLGAVIQIDPNSGAQSVVVTGGGTSTGGNTGTTLNDTSQFAPWLVNQFVGVPVTITSGTGVGQTRTVSSNTTNQLTISSSWDITPDATSTFRIGYINGPNVLVYKGGFLYVATEALADGTVHSLVRVDPVSGAQTLITDGNNGPHFSIAVGMGLPPGNSDPNDVYVGDEPGNVQGSDPGKVWKVNIINGQQTIVSQNGPQGSLFNHPVDLTVESSGTILVVNTGTGGFNGSVIRIDPTTGNQSLVTSFTGTPNGGLDSIDVGNGPFGSGTIFVGAISFTGVDARIYAADPTQMTTNPPVLTSDTLMSEVEGIRVFHAPVQGNNPPSVTPPSNQTANEGTLQNINLGSFSDQNPGTWSATINWGDFSSNTTFNPNAPGTLGTQPHTYGEEGTYTVTIAVTNNSDHLSGFGMFTVAVSDLNVVAMAASVNPTAGAPYTGPVATFTDPGGPEANDGTHYSATINWGDNSAPTTGTITLVNGVFTVSGMHTYAAANTYNIMITINHELTTTPLSEMVSVTNLGQFVQAGLIKPISFWAGLQGQELLRRFGPTASGQSLGQWLATTFPNLYGGQNGAPNLSPFTNAQISNYYLSLFLVSKGTGLDAEVLATALEVFTTTLSLGGTTGQANGFTVNSNGLGAYSWNVGPSGQAFGVPNNTVLNVYQILLDTNNSASGGEPWGTNTFLRNQGLAVYMGINSV